MILFANVASACSVLNGLFAAANQEGRSVSKTEYDSPCVSSRGACVAVSD